MDLKECVLKCKNQNPEEVFGKKINVSEEYLKQNLEFQEFIFNNNVKFKDEEGQNG